MLSCFSGLDAMYSMSILIRMADALGCSWLEPDSLAGCALIHAPIHQSDQRFNGFGYDRQPGRTATACGSTDEPPCRSAPRAKCSESAWRRPSAGDRGAFAERNGESHRGRLPRHPTDHVADALGSLSRCARVKPSRAAPRSESEATRARFPLADICPAQR